MSADEGEAPKPVRRYFATVDLATRKKRKHKVPGSRFNRHPPPFSQIEKAREKRLRRRDATMTTIQKRLTRGRRAAMKGRSTKDTKWLGPSIMDLLLASSQSYAALGEACGVHPNTIYYWVQGRSEPSFSRAMRLAKYLRVSPYVLATWCESRRREWNARRRRTQEKRGG